MRLLLRFLGRCLFAFLFYLPQWRTAEPLLKEGAVRGNLHCAAFAYHALLSMLDPYVTPADDARVGAPPAGGRSPWRRASAAPSSQLPSSGPSSATILLHMSASLAPGTVSRNRRGQLQLPTSTLFACKSNPRQT